MPRNDLGEIHDEPLMTLESHKDASDAISTPELRP